MDYRSSLNMALSGLARASLLRCRGMRTFSKGPSRSGSLGNWCKCRSLAVVTGAVATCASFFYLLDVSVEAALAELKSPHYPWKFDRPLVSFDHAALRRGWEVYKNVCRTCHSLTYLRFMDLVNVTHTEEEAKAIAAEFEVQDGPDENGEYYMRPAKLSDAIPPVFANEQAARAANSGAYPHDLSLIVYTRRNGKNFVFSLLTGYMDPPAGVKLDDGQYFNPYFPGGVLAMGEMIQDGIVDYEDGTPATKSQIAKDVVEFLSWMASREHDTRKAMTIKATGIVLIMFFAVWKMKRQTWACIMNTQIRMYRRRC